MEDTAMWDDIEYKAALEKKYKLEEILEKSLSSEQNEQFGKCLDQAGEVQYIVSKQHFLQGFALGSRIMMEVFMRNTDENCG